MVNTCKTMYEASDVNSVLDKLKVRAPSVHNAVQKSYFAFASCGPNFPHNFPGITAWAHAFNGMADELKPDGWEFKTEHGQPQLVSPDGTMAITVAAGDSNTGINGSKQPRTKARKGKITIEGVTANAFLFSEMESYLRTKIEKAKMRNLWILLVYRSFTAGKVYCELSRPIMMEAEKWRKRKMIIGWSERIILEPVEFEATAKATTRKEIQESEAKSAEITVEIKRRSRK